MKNQKKDEELKEVDQFKRDIEDESFASLIDLLVQMRTSHEIKKQNEDDLDVTEVSKINLKIKALKSEINERFLENNTEESEEERGNVSEVSSILSL